MPSKTTDAPKESQAAGTQTPDKANTNAKLQSLEAVRSDATGQALRTNQGVRIADNQNTLKAGDRGPSLLEDFIMSASRSGSSMHAAPVPMATSRATATMPP